MIYDSTVMFRSLRGSAYARVSAQIGGINRELAVQMWNIWDSGENRSENDYPSFIVYTTQRKQRCRNEQIKN